FSIGVPTTLVSFAASPGFSSSRLASAIARRSSSGIGIGSSRGAADSIVSLRLRRSMMHPRTLRLLFAAALAAVLVLSLWPLTEPPPLHTGWDKTDHLAAFVALGLLGLPSWPQHRA